MNDDSSMLNQIFVSVKLHGDYVKCENHTSNTLSAYLSWVIRYILHYFFNSVVIPNTPCFLSFSLYFNLLLVSISLAFFWYILLISARKTSAHNISTLTIALTICISCLTCLIMGFISLMSLTLKLPLVDYYFHIYPNKYYCKLK